MKLGQDPRCRCSHPPPLVLSLLLCSPFHFIPPFQKHAFWYWLFLFSTHKDLSSDVSVTGYVSSPRTVIDSHQVASWGWPSSGIHTPVNSSGWEFRYLGLASNQQICKHSRVFECHPHDSMLLSKNPPLNQCKRFFPNPASRRKCSPENLLAALRDPKQKTQRNLFASWPTQTVRQTNGCLMGLGCSSVGWFIV